LHLKNSLQRTKRILIADCRFRDEGHGMMRLWKKIVHNATSLTIQQPYLSAATVVLFALMAGMWRDHGLAGYVFRFGFLFMAFVRIYFLARAVDTLRVEDTVPQPDALVGMHLNQK
jgi:hypothetical protein